MPQALVLSAVLPVNGFNPAAGKAIPPTGAGR
jgi:hypothetical protein